MMRILSDNTKHATYFLAETAFSSNRQTDNTEHKKQNLLHHPALNKTESTRVHGTVHSDYLTSW